MCGYDIGCGFNATLTNSRKVGPTAQKHAFSLCVNAFHGYAHCRSCQLRHHPLYKGGVGDENFEGCERIFSQTNGVAAVTRHASKFHRRQEILHNVECWNFEKYANLSTCLRSDVVHDSNEYMMLFSGRLVLNNAKSTLASIKTLSVELEHHKCTLGIETNTIFHVWRLEELRYLESLKKPKESDILAREYVRTLKKLKDAS